MRKKAASLAEAKEETQKYVRGPQSGRRRKVSAESSLTDFERELKRELACYLKAIDFGYKYIADSLEVTENVVKKWFQEDEMQTKTAKIQKDQIAHGLKQLRSYTLELIHGMMEIWRTTEDKRLAFDIYKDILDRVGLTKVNKSEGLVVNENRTQVDIADPSGLLDAMREAPPEAQQAMAEHLEAALAVAAEHGEREVTHNAG